MLDSKRPIKAQSVASSPNCYIHLKKLFLIGVCVSGSVRGRCVVINDVRPVSELVHR